MHYRLFRWFPKSEFSRLMGILAERPWPGWLLRPVIWLYVRVYRIDMAHFEAPEEGFPTFNAFFTRALRTGVRPLDSGARRIVSPVDGRVSASGRIETGRLFQAKGMDYSLGELLAGGTVAESYEQGAFLTLYLSPRDYHRIHSPCAGRVRRFSYTPGELWTVSPTGIASVPDLFARNERLLTVLDTQWGELLLVAVGAMVVGKIRTVYHPIISNLAGAQPLAEDLAVPYALEKGQELGRFELGSTVILLFPRGVAALDALAPGEAVALGEGIGSFL
ncbi:MAG: archaetidylserine decarboxylase [SAR324 cluster bacterium]|nr:archaetidylserine decarboxylase [SAR324 cluster bacterium]